MSQCHKCGSEISAGEPGCRICGAPGKIDLMEDSLEFDSTVNMAFPNKEEVAAARAEAASPDIGEKTLEDSPGPEAIPEVKTPEYENIEQIVEPSAHIAEPKPVADFKTGPDSEVADVILSSSDLIVEPEPETPADQIHLASPDVV